MNNISLEEYVKALEKMKRSPRDRLGILGELSATGLGVSAGVAISGTAASVAGFATLAGSTTLASALGGIFVTATPIGWVVGSAFIGGALAYATTKAIRSGSKADLLKMRTIREIEERIRSLRSAALNHESENQKFSQVISIVQLLVVNKHLTQAKGTEILAMVERKQLDITEAFNLLESLMAENSLFTSDA